MCSWVPVASRWARCLEALKFSLLLGCGESGFELGVGEEGFVSGVGLRRVFGLSSVSGSKGRNFGNWESGFGSTVATGKWT